MKKQILFIAFFTLALIFAGINKSIGQEKPTPPALAALPTCITPTPLAALCSGNPLTPLAGVSYTYEVNVPTPAGTKTYNWFVTTSQEFIKKDATTLASSITATIDAIGGSHILAVGSTANPIGSANYGSYNNQDVIAPVGGDGNFKIEISWKYWVHDPTAPVFLVVYASNDATCDNDNIQVYIIKPTHSFTLDIAGINADETLGVPNALVGPCAAPVSSALWVAPTLPTYPDGQIVVEHGVNYLYYMVTAANFNNSWLPKFQVSGAGIDASGTRDRAVTAIDWQYSTKSNLTAAWNPTVVTFNPGVAAPTFNDGYYEATGSGAGAGGIDVPVVALDATTKFAGSGGECIIVRVTVANHRIETLVADPITLAVDGIMYDAASAGAKYTNATLGDIHWTAGPNAATVPAEKCPWIDLFANDKATVNIMPRPDVQSVTAPGGNLFVPKKQD